MACPLVRLYKCLYNVSAPTFLQPGYAPGFCAARLVNQWTITTFLSIYFTTQAYTSDTGFCLEPLLALRSMHQRSQRHYRLVPSPARPMVPGIANLWHITDVSALSGYTRSSSMPQNYICLIGSWSLSLPLGPAATQTTLHFCHYRPVPQHTRITLCSLLGTWRGIAYFSS